MMNYKTQKILNKLTFGLTEMGAGFSLSDIWYNLNFGLKNLKRFFWVVWKYRGWDYTHNLQLLKRGLEVYLTFPNMEIDEGRIPKETDIKRSIEIINNLTDELVYIDMAEEELGEMKEYNKSFEFKELDDRDDDNEPLYEMVDLRDEVDQDHAHDVYMGSHEIQQEEWNELFNLMRDKGQGWWN